MLTDSIKLNSLWKGNEGWANTHAKREVFEELYRSFKSISANNVLTYGHLIPREENDEYFNDVKNLTSVNPIWKYPESSYKDVPVVELVTELKVTPISPNCNDTFILLDENGKQIKNIIPYDYSDAGIYNYTLKNYRGGVIPFGMCEWHLDVDSATLTFNNGVPEDVSSANPPSITFYKYVGPTGERTYIDASLYDVENIPFQDASPVVEFTQLLKARLDDIWEGWFDKFGFKGDDLNQGIGLQYNLLTNVIESETGDAVMGWDDNSQSQVASILSHKKASDPSVVFVSEHLPLGDYTVQVTETGYSKIDIENGFVVVNANSTGSVSFTVEESESIYAVLLVKDNETADMELYLPRSDVELTLQVPVFVDLKILPPHLKLKTLSSYSDEIIPQYYGPRVADFVIASYEDTVSLRSADFIVYNKESAYLGDAFKVRSGNHIFLRSGSYENDDEELLIEDMYVEGESLLHTNIKNCTLKLKGSVILEGLNLTGVKVIVDTDSIVEIKDCAAGDVEVSNGTLCIRDTSLNTVEVEKDANLLAYGSHIEDLICDEGFVSINGSTIKDLHLNKCLEGSVLNTTNITNVLAWDTTAKLDSSYAMKFDESIPKELYPDEKTIPYYNSFGDRVYAKLPDPFKYVEESNEIHIKIDNFTIKLDKETGNLYCRFFTSNEITMDSVPVTQTEEVYGIHEDSNLYKKAYNYATKQFEYVLDADGNKIPIDKPITVDDAIMDLYWSKAGLVKGKIPIDQLPDSVAYGGLSFVGMWSFEDHDGAYPEFKDIDVSTMSDDQYTDLQRGWFFIVEASRHVNDEDGKILDDPCYPQTAVDGEIFTAGDWIVYEGRSTPAAVENVTAQPLNILSPVNKNKETLLQGIEGGEYTHVWSSGQQYAKDKKFGLSTLAFFEDHADLYKSDETGFHFVETFPVEYVVGLFDVANPEVEPYKTVTQIKIGEYTFKVNGTAVRKDNSSYDAIETAYIYKEDYLKGTNQMHPRLLLSAEDEASQIWAEEVFASLPSGFCLRPTTLEGWFDKEHKESEKQLDLIDLPFQSNVRAYAGASFEMYNKWGKVDRAYSDPVYSRLPEYAPNTNGTNKGWSLEKGGVGKLELSSKTLAEALRLINEELWNLSPSIPASIRNISVVVDEESSNIKEEKYIQVKAPGILSDYLKAEESNAFNCDESILIFKQKGLHDHLPLEHEFYINPSDDFNFEILDGDEAVGLYDNTTLSTLFPIAKEGFVVDIQDPYLKYNLGIKGPSNFKSAEVSGLMTFTEQQDFEQAYSICYKLSGLKPNPYVPSIDHLVGRSKPLEFVCHRFYDGSDVKIRRCDPANANIADLNAAMSTKIAGIPFLMGNFTLKSDFIVEDFISYEALRKTDGVELIAVVDGEARPEIHIPFTGYLESKVVADKPGTYNLRVVFDYTIGECMNLETGLHSFGILAKVTSGETTTDETEVFLIKNVNYLKAFPENIVSADPVLIPILGQGVFNGTDYKQEVDYESCAELILAEDGYRWPSPDKQYPLKFSTVDTFKKIQTGDQIQDGILNVHRYRTMTFKFDLSKIHDLTGIGIQLEYGNDTRPEINKFTGEFTSELRIEVLPHSSENKCVNFLNANGAIESAFFEAKLTPQEKVLYPGKSDLETRRVTFGRTPIPVSEVYVRIMIKKDSNIAIKNVSIDVGTGC